MKRTLDSLLAVAGFVVVGAGLVLMLVLAFRAMSRGGVPAAPGATQPPQGYPPPEATELPPSGYPAPQVTAVPTISPAERTAIEATVIAEATASAPAPIPTAGPVIGPQTIYDPVNHFRLTLSPGWYAAGATDIANYDISHIEGRPPDGLIIQINSGQLTPGQSFEQWLADYRVQETSPENGAFGVTLTPPQPYKLGSYGGVSYVATGQEGESVLVLVIPSGDGWVAVITLSPYDSSNSPSLALSEALSMLSTIEVSSKPPP